MAAAAVQESGDPLCCCEYINVKGERSHVLAFLCDCESVDDTCDRFIRCQSIPTENYTAVWDTLFDRLRIPSFLGSGAHRLDEVFDIQAVLPIVLIPTSLYIASLNFYLTVATFMCLPITTLLYFRQVSRVKKRTKFFFSWGLVSVFCIGFVFYVYVVPSTPITEFETLIVTSLTIVMFLAFLLSKKNPGIVRKIVSVSKSRHNNKIRKTGNDIKYKSESRASWDTDHEGQHSNGNHGSIRRNGNHGDIRGSEDEETEDVHTVVDIGSSDRDGWCAVCEVTAPPRAGHCRVCQHCVQHLDHHCVWIDSCIGSNNHRSFLCSLFLIVMVGMLGSHFSLQRVCHYTYQDQAYLPQINCSHVYNDNTSAIVFATVVYALLAVCGFAALLLQQCYLISHGIMYREYRFQDNTYYNKNFIRNWVNFVCKRPTRHLQII